MLTHLNLDIDADGPFLVRLAERRPLRQGLGKAATMVQADTSATACPAWCDDHVGDLHQGRIGESSGHLQVVVERHDSGGRIGRPQLSFRFCPDGDLIDDSTEFPLDVILGVLNQAQRM